MGLLDRFRSKQSNEPVIMTKEPGFAVTQFTSNNPFTNLIAPEDNYFEQYILYSAKAIDYIANKVASSDIFLTDKEEQILENNELWDDLQAFNPYMTLWEARKLKEVHKLTTGAAYWYIDRNPGGGRKAAFYPLDPTNMQVKTNSTGLPAYYQYIDANGKTVELAIEDVIFFRRTDPKNWFQGQSIFKELSFWTNAYASGAQYNMNKLGNSANVDKFIIFEGISEANRKELEERLHNKYAGPRNAGRTGVLETKAEVLDMSPNQKDLDYVSGMKMLRQDILAAFGIPEALFFPSATNSNTKEAVRLFQADTLEPLMQQEKSTLNEQVIPKYGSARAKEGNVFFDFAPVVDEDLNELVEQSDKMWNAGFATLNEVRKHAHLEPIEGPEGDMFKTEPKVEEPMPDSEQKDLEDDQTQEEIKLLKEKTLKLATILDDMIEKQDEAEFLTKNVKLADDQEAMMHASAETLFRGQFADTIKYLESNSKPTVRGVFNYDEQKANTINAFKESYNGIIGNSNSVANTEIKQKFLKNKSPNAVGYKDKALSGAAADQLAEHINYFAGELTTTTQKKLRKIISDGIDKGFDSAEFVRAVQDLFNGFVDGASNIDVLTQYGVYEPDMFVEEGQVKYAQGQRYQRMLDAISRLRESGELSAEDMNAALKALRGLISPGDPIGTQVDTLLTTIYKVNKDKGISFARAVTIARTESTYARNLGFEDTYSDNPFIVGKRWRSLNDSATRHDHSVADGQVVGVNESFNVGGDMLKFPGDGSQGASAANIVNCRCRITAVVTD